MRNMHQTTRTIASAPMRFAVLQNQVEPQSANVRSQSRERSPYTKKCGFSTSGLAL
jgi:hypothetical protein